MRHDGFCLHFEGAKSTVDIENTSLQLTCPETLHLSFFIDAIADLSMKAGTYMLSGIAELYDNTPKSSPLRRLWVDLLVFGQHESWLSDIQEDHSIPNEALLELLSAVSKAKWNQKGSDAPYLNNMCQYHQHKGPGICYKWKYKMAGVPNSIFPERLTSGLEIMYIYSCCAKLRQNFLSCEHAPRPRI